MLKPIFNALKENASERAPGVGGSEVRELVGPAQRVHARGVAVEVVQLQELHGHLLR